MSCASRRPGSNYKAGSDRAIAVRPLFHHADISSILRPRRAHFHCKLRPLVAMTNYIFIYTQLGWTPLLRLRPNGLSSLDSSLIKEGRRPRAKIAKRVGINFVT